MSSHERPSATNDVSRKRKDRGILDPVRTDLASKPGPPAQPPDPVQQPSFGSGRLLMAGYLAHEFLTKGTILGKPGVATGKLAIMSPPPKPVQVTGQSQTYSEVSRMLLSRNGAHIPGVFNPTELARWLQK